MSTQPPDTEELLRRATAGDAAAETALLARHRARLRCMVSIRFDERIAGGWIPRMSCRMCSRKPPKVSQTTCGVAHCRSTPGLARWPGSD